MKLTTKDLIAEVNKPIDEGKLPAWDDIIKIIKSFEQKRKEWLKKKHVCDIKGFCACYEIKKQFFGED